jgi:hypothetical protein
MKVAVNMILNDFTPKMLLKNKNENIDIFIQVSNCDDSTYTKK